MNVEYVQVESTVKPEIIERGVSTVYLRKDITEKTRVSENGDEQIYWSYLEAKFSYEKFDAYVGLVMAENALKGVNDSDNINKLVEGQEMDGNYQLAVLEAVADLYEALANNV